MTQILNIIITQMQINGCFGVVNIIHIFHVKVVM